MAERISRSSLIERVQVLARELHAGVEDGSFYELPRAERRRRIRSIQRLYGSLIPSGLAAPLRGSIAAAGALLLSGCFGIEDPLPDGPVAQTPDFSATAVKNPFGINAAYDEWLTITPRIVVADIDVDGDLDFGAALYTEGGHGFSSIAKTSAGTFAPGTLNDPYTYLSGYDFGIPSTWFPPGPTPVYQTALAAIADLDDDGDPDAILVDTMVDGTYADGGVMIGRNIQGQSEAPLDDPIFLVPTSREFTVDRTPVDADAADMDGDGDYDLLLVENGTIYFSANTGTAEFPAFANPVTSPYGSSSITGFSVVSVDAVDLDADGDLDILVGATSTADGSPAVFLMDNTSTVDAVTFATPVQNPGGIVIPGSDWSSYDGGPGIAAADFDGDGDIDILLGPNVSPQLTEFDYYNDFYLFDNGAVQ